MTTTSRLAPTEAALRDAIDIDEAWRTVERLATTVRLSGSAEERQAIDYLRGKLDAFGVAYELHEPTLFVSWPLGASLRVLGDEPLTVTAKTPSMSVIFSPASVTAFHAAAPISSMAVRPGASPQPARPTPTTALPPRRAVCAIPVIPAPGRTRLAARRRR